MTVQPAFSASNRRKGADGAEEFLKSRRGFDPATGTHIVKIISGDWYVTSAKNEMLTTILGSCISACIRDPEIGVGGMNHFLLPGDAADIHEGQAARYGAFAMEKLLNAVFSAGGRKERLEIKLFGGGNVTSNSGRIGSRNAEFVREFMHQEGYKIFAEDLGGTIPRRVHYYPSSGKVLLRRLQRKDDLWVVEEEEKYQKKLNINPLEGGVDLF